MAVDTEIARLFVTIGADATGFNNKMKSADGALSKFASGSARLVAGIGKASLAVATSIAATAVTLGSVLGKAVISSYADYEQLIGGIDTLFKDSSKKIQDYAENAYKTAGLSANAYMETVTSFSASLIQSLGGDTNKAAEYADMAITDMADNANKMGTSMEMIQNAYQGFAKQNYTMLDNLKLGYGGTKEEMQRLLDHAEQLPGALGREFNISNYADIVEAIHLVQTEMGITGTTALEAEKTITGSLSTLKGAFSNLLTGLGNPGAAIEQLMSDVVIAFENVVTNIQPVIENLISVLPQAFDALFTAISDVLPDLISIASELFIQMIDVIIASVPTLIPVLIDSLSALGEAILNAAPVLLDAVSEIITELFIALQNNVQPISDAALSIVSALVNFITANASLVAAVAMDLVLALGNGLIKALPGMLPAIQNMLNGLVNIVLENLDALIELGLQLTVLMIEAMTGTAAMGFIMSKMPEIVSAIVKAFTNNINTIIQCGMDLLENLIQGMVNNINFIIVTIPQIVAAIINELMSVDWGAVGGDIVRAIAGGISLNSSTISGSIANAATVGTAAGVGTAATTASRPTTPGIATNVGDAARRAAGQPAFSIPKEEKPNTGYSYSPPTTYAPPSIGGGGGGGGGSGGSAASNQALADALSNFNPIVTVIGTIRHEGISAEGELVEVVDQIVRDKLQWETLLAGG